MCVCVCFQSFCQTCSWSVLNSCWKEGRKEGWWVRKSLVMGWATMEKKVMLAYYHHYPLFSVPTSNTSLKEKTKKQISTSSSHPQLILPLFLCFFTNPKASWEKAGNSSIDMLAKFQLCQVSVYLGLSILLLACKAKIKSLWTRLGLVRKQDQLGGGLHQGFHQ